MIEDVTIGTIMKLCRSYGDCKACETANRDLYKWCVENSRRPPAEWKMKEWLQEECPKWNRIDEDDPKTFPPKDQSLEVTVVVEQKWYNYDTCALTSEKTAVDYLDAYFSDEGSFEVYHSQFDDIDGALTFSDFRTNGYTLFPPYKNSIFSDTVYGKGKNKEKILTEFKVTAWYAIPNETYDEEDDNDTKGKDS